MFTGFTYQDWQEKNGSVEMLLEAIHRYKGSDDFTRGLEASLYYEGDSPLIADKRIIKAEIIKSVDEHGTSKRTSRPTEVIGNRISDNFLKRFVIQQNQHLLGNGVTLGNEATKKKLGLCFDKRLQKMGQNAILHGVCYGFWNLDHLECIQAVKDRCSGAFGLLDEMTGDAAVVVQFWQIDTNRPMYVRVYEPDGVTLYRQAKGGGKLGIVQPKQAYHTRVNRDSLGETVLGVENYASLPVIAMYANEEKKSEFTPAIKRKIDAFDVINSDFADNLERANEVYWVLNNFGGDVDGICEMIETINRVKAVANYNDGTGSATAEMKTIEVPYAARETALKLLREQLYEDWMALDMKQMTGGSLTNVAIKSNTMMLNAKVDLFEWQAFDFVQKVLRLLGIETEEIKFKRQEYVNRQEIVTDIQTMRQDIDLRTALKLNPYIDQEEIDEIMNNVDAKTMTGISTAEELQKQIDEMKAAADGGNGSYSPEDGEDEQA